MRVQNENIEEIREEIDKAKIVEKRRKSSAGKSKEKVIPVFEIIFADRVDFAVRKKLKRITKTFVFLFSKKIFYIYTEPEGVVEDITSASINNFFSGVNDLTISLKNGDQFKFESSTARKCKAILAAMVDVANETSFCACYNNRTLEGKPEGNVDYNLILTEIVTMEKYIDMYRSWIRDAIVPLYKRSKKICLYLKNQTGIYKKIFFQSYRSDVWNRFLEIFNIFGFDNSKKLIDSFFAFENLLNESYLFADDVNKTIKKCNIDITRLTEYLITDLYSRQYESFHTYIDTMDMEMDLYGKVRNKYPKALEIRHRVLARAVSEKRYVDKNSTEFKDAMGNLEKDYSYAYKNYRIIMPEEPVDLINEGTELGHCVAEYVSKVAAGDCIVLFLREKANPKKSFLTIEVIGDRITQVEGYQRNISINEEIYEFLDKFAKNKELIIDAPINIIKEEKETA